MSLQFSQEKRFRKKKQFLQVVWLPVSSRQKTETLRTKFIIGEEIMKKSEIGILQICQELQKQQMPLWLYTQLFFSPANTVRKRVHCEPEKHSSHRSDSEFDTVWGKTNNQSRVERTKNWPRKHRIISAAWLRTKQSPRVETGAFPSRVEGIKFCWQFFHRSVFYPCGLPLFQLTRFAL